MGNGWCERRGITLIFLRARALHFSLACTRFAFFSRVHAYPFTALARFRRNLNFAFAFWMQLRKALLHPKG